MRATPSTSLPMNCSSAWCSDARFPNGGLAPPRRHNRCRPPWRRALAARGVDSLWTHQAPAIDALRAGPAHRGGTGTASGKSLCYSSRSWSRYFEAGHDTALPHLSHQGARAGSTPRVSGMARTRTGRSHVRRRYRDRRAHVGAHTRQRPAHKPRDAAHGDHGRRMRDGPTS